MASTRSQALLLVAVALIGCFALASTVSAEPVREPVPIVRDVHQPQEGNGATDDDVVPPVLWTIAAVAGGAVIMGTLYLLKRRVGGFPENPDWVAPISVMRSRDLPDETTWPEGSSNDEPHGAHH